jgi:hypothetical protein
MKNRQRKYIVPQKINGNPNLTARFLRKPRIDSILFGWSNSAPDNITNRGTLTAEKALYVFIVNQRTASA